VRQVKRLDKEVPELTIWRKMACIKKPSLVTKIKVLEAHGLEKIDKFGGYLNVTLNSDEIIENNATFFYRTRYLLHGGMWGPDCKKYNRIKNVAPEMDWIQRNILQEKHKSTSETGSEQIAIICH